MAWSRTETVLGFARALRAAGVEVTADRELSYLQAVDAVGLGERTAVYWAGRATLTASLDDVAAYDRVFGAWFGGQRVEASRAPERVRISVVQAPLSSGEGEGAEASAVPLSASAAEVLRHRDVATLDPAERDLLRQLFARLRPALPQRRARRHARAARGRVDGPATLREQLHRLGEPGPIRYRRRTTRPRRVVVLVDVSGSMSAYADALLRLAHVLVQAGPRHTEVFTVGTRLTPVTRALRERDPDHALLAAGASVPDWSGGTRLGEGIAAFLDRWGRRGMARGAVVVVLSDGWERDGTELLGEQMRRLRALAHRVVWVNPHRGKAGYAPVQGGIAAALPHVDDFVAGHSMATFETALRVVAGTDGRR